MDFECPEKSPAEVVSAIDQPPPQVQHIKSQPGINITVLFFLLHSQCF